MRGGGALCLATALAVAAASCGESADEETSQGAAEFESGSGGLSGESDDAGDEVAADQEPAVPQDPSAAAGGEAPSGLPGQGANAERLLRREAFLVVEVTDLEEAVTTASGETTVSGGYLSSERSSPETASLVLRVPSEEFDRVLATIGDLGELRQQEITTDDRTEEIVDLQARLETAEASLERTRGFFAEANDVDDLTLLENEVANRESLVASLQAQLDNEISSVSLSTIRVDFQLSSDVEPEIVSDDEPLPGIADALDGSWNALRSTGYVIALVAVALLPWLPVVVVLVLAIYLWARRRRRRQRSRPVTAAAARAPGRGRAVTSVAAPPPPQAPPPPSAGDAGAPETATEASPEGGDQAPSPNPPATGPPAG
jgi:hypothetical protein